MKKILAILLAAVLVFSFAACKKNDDNTTSTGDSEVQSSEQPADGSVSDETSDESSTDEVVTDTQGNTVAETKPASTATRCIRTQSKGLSRLSAAIRKCLLRARLPQTAPWALCSA